MRSPYPKLIRWALVCLICYAPLRAEEPAQPEQKPATDTSGPPPSDDGSTTGGKEPAGDEGGASATEDSEEKKRAHARLIELLGDSKDDNATEFIVPGQTDEDGNPVKINLLTELPRLYPFLTEDSHPDENGARMATSLWKSRYKAKFQGLIAESQRGKRVTAEQVYDLLFQNAQDEYSRLKGNYDSIVWPDQKIWNKKMAPYPGQQESFFSAKLIDQEASRLGPESMLFLTDDQRSDIQRMQEKARSEIPTMSCHSLGSARGGICLGSPSVTSGSWWDRAKSKSLFQLAKASETNPVKADDPGGDLDKDLAGDGEEEPSSSKPPAKRPQPAPPNLRQQLSGARTPEEKVAIIKAAIKRGDLVAVMRSGTYCGPCAQVKQPFAKIAEGLVQNGGQALILYAGKANAPQNPFDPDFGKKEGFAVLHDPSGRISRELGGFGNTVPGFKIYSGGRRVGQFNSTNMGLLTRSLVNAAGSNAGIDQAKLSQLFDAQRRSGRGDLYAAKPSEGCQGAGCGATGCSGAGCGGQNGCSGPGCGGQSTAQTGCSGPGCGGGDGSGKGAGGENSESTSSTPNTEGGGSGGGSACAVPRDLGRARPGFELGGPELWFPMLLWMQLWRRRQLKLS